MNIPLAAPAAGFPTALAAAAITAVATVLVTFSREIYVQWREGRSVARLLAAEIEVILTLDADGQFSASVKKLRDDIEAGRVQKIPTSFTLEPSPGDVYSAVITKIGLLPAPVAVQVVRFHNFLVGVRVAARNLPGANPGDPLVRSVLVAQMDRGLAAWKTCVQVGTDVLPRLRRIAGDPPGYAAPPATAPGGPQTVG